MIILVKYGYSGIANGISRFFQNLAVGFLGRQHDGYPGPKAIWEGMQKVRAFAMALEAGKAAYTEDG